MCKVWQRIGIRVFGTLPKAVQSISKSTAATFVLFEHESDLLFVSKNLKMRH